MKRLVTSLATLLMAIACCVSHASAQTITLIPVEDATGTGTSAAGPITSIGPLANFNIEAYAEDPHGMQRLAMEFDITSLPPANQIGSATLSWVHYIGAGTFDVHGYAGNGIIEVADMNLSNVLLPAVPVPDWIAMDVTSFVKGLVTSGESYAGFMGANTAPRDNHPKIYAKDALFSYQWPKLIVTQVPEPSTAMLAMIGMAACSSRRKNAQKSWTS
jgi:hypothetical protein